MQWDNLRMLRDRHPDYYQSHVGFNVTAAPPDSMPQVYEFLNANPEMLGQKIINVSVLKQDPSDVLEAIGVPEEDAAIDHDWIWKIFLESCVKGERPHDLTRSICEPSMSRLHSWIFLG